LRVDRNLFPLRFLLWQVGMDLEVLATTTDPLRASVKPSEASQRRSSGISPGFDVRAGMTLQQNRVRAILERFGVEAKATVSCVTLPPCLRS
jgi:hypothetical protein